MHVEDISAPNFDRIIRQTGRHFIWISGSCSRRGLARTVEKVIARSLGRALNAISAQCNAAELESVFVTRLPGCYIARVTLDRRRIQQHTALDNAESGCPVPLAAS